MVHRFSLGSSASVDLLPTVEEGPLETGAIVVALESVRLTNLISRDNQRDGTIAFNVNGQETVLSWAADESGRLENPDKFPGQILFLGEHEGLLDLSVSVSESSQDVLRRISRLRASLGLAASVAGLIPGPGALAAQGFGLASALAGALSKQDEDDVELLFEGSIGELGASGNLLPLRRSGYGIRRNSERGNDILLVFRVMPFHPLERDLEVVVLLESVDLELRSLRRQLVFEASLGSGRRSANTSFTLPLKNGLARLDQILGIQNKVLYRGPWKWGVPFHFNLSTLTQKDATALKEVVNEAGGFIQATLERSTSRKLASGITKAVQSARSMILEFLPTKQSIGILSGLITAPATVKDLSQEEKSWFIPIEDLDGWQDSSLDLGSEKVGKARLNLKIKRADAPG